jgi:twitching motility protein PilJ
MAERMGTMEPKEVGEAPAAAGLTVQPFRYTEMAPAAGRPTQASAAAAAAAAAARASAPTQKIDRSKIPSSSKNKTFTARMIDRAQRSDLPGIGKRPMTQQLQALVLLLALFIGLVVVVMVLDHRGARMHAEVSEQIAAMTVHGQRMARVAAAAAEGNAAAMAELKASREQMRELQASLGRNASGPIAGELARFADTWKASDAAAARILAQEKPLAAFGTLLAAVNESAPRIAAQAEELLAQRTQQNAPSREIGQLAQLSVAAWRMARDVNALPAGAAGADAADLLARDLAQFREATQALTGGAEGEMRNRLQPIARASAELQSAATAGLAAAAAVAEAAAARTALQAGAEPARRSLESIQGLATDTYGGRVLYLAAGVLFLLLASATVLAIMQVLLRGSRRRMQEAEARRLEAQKLEQTAKKANEQNQAAILRLMNELQEVADGNLTVQATVTEDITGAIADSINYTVEELRGLVSRINDAAAQVDGASSEARDIAARLMTSSEAQAKDLQDTGSSVLQMTARIGDVSRTAGESAKVARMSLENAERGQRAVYNQIAGMNEIREQIQETAKRIKRLGESSQEIGEIVELISDITEQTNVLALNAAIQAAAAGEAGRGFSVVAEEVQRLADRSAEAAKQIAALVKTIQTDTQDAVAAMEKSTQGVVEGTKLSDAAGTALADIGRVSRQLADLIERIDGATQEQSGTADEVAKGIERILGVNDQTTEGTRRAADAIGQLAGLARELKDSVARFRVA